MCGAIARGDFYSADLKKLSGGEFFRAKLDYDSRLLVRFVEHAGQRACLALEVIEQHAYDRSRSSGARAWTSKRWPARPPPSSPTSQNLKYQAQYAPPKRAEEIAGPLRERSMSHYGKDSAKVLQEVTRHGLEHRSMFGMTPLMMAADAGNLALVETLLERGARLDAVDSLGRFPVHFALRRAFQDSDYARDKLGALFALLCPTSIDLEVDDKRSRLTKAQGEFFLLLLMVTRFHDLYAGAARFRGFQTAHVDEQLRQAFPRSVIPEERRRRVYWNGVLARAEVSSSYKPARKLWRREKQGHYIPSSVGVRVAGEEGKPDVYVPLDRLLGLDILEPRLKEQPSLAREA